MGFGALTYQWPVAMLQKHGYSKKDGPGHHCAKKRMSQSRYISTRAHMHTCPKFWILDHTATPAHVCSHATEQLLAGASPCGLITCSGTRGCCTAAREATFASKCCVIPAKTTKYKHADMCAEQLCPFSCIAGKYYSSMRLPRPQHQR